MADSPPTSRARIARGLACAVVLAHLAGCDTLWKRGDDGPLPDVEPPTLPGKAAAQRVSQFVFYSDTPIKPNAPLFTELAALRDQVYRDLRLAPANTVIQVYLFDDQDKYERYMRYRYPDLPKRRAFFVGVPRPGGGARDLLVYTFWGDHLRLDLRHELTHALLNGVMKDVPLWLDEGLAEYYELPPEKDGVNGSHLEALRKGEVALSLAALEQLEQVAQMGRPQYQEAWAWTHLMLRTTPEARAVLFEYLQQLRDPTSRPGPLSARLRAVYPNPEEALGQHLTALDPPAARLRPVVDRN
jgi:hypothetical protein